MWGITTSFEDSHWNDILVHIGGVDDDTIVINLARDVLLESNKILVIVDFVVMIYLPLLFNCNLKKNMIGCLLMKLGIRMAFVE